MATLWTLLGVAIISTALTDIFLSVLHLDRSGLITPALHRGIWRLMIAGGRRLPRARRSLLALAGPIMLVSMLGLWVVQLILGFALVYWPQLDSFRSDEQLTSLSFVDALYFSGGTGTVLGYGDITPLAPGIKVVSFIEAGLGFVVLTGAVTYLLNVVNGVAERNAVALRLHLETGRSDDGVEALIRWSGSEDPKQLRDRLQSLTAILANLHQKLHHFPILDLYYRSEDPILDPEPMLQTSSQLALAGSMLASDPRARALRPAAQDLEAIVTDILTLLARQYLPNQIRARLVNPRPDPEDRAAIDSIGARLDAALGGEAGGEARVRVDDERLLALASRTRVVLEALDQLTAWRLDHPAS